MNKPRGELPNKPDPAEGPLFPVYASARRHLPPGPMRHRHRRHFLRQEGIGLLIMTTMVIVILYWVLRDLGMCPDFFAGK